MMPWPACFICGMEALCCHREFELARWYRDMHDDNRDNRDLTRTPAELPLPRPKPPARETAEPSGRAGKAAGG
jgi:hypothetical protein